MRPLEAAGVGKMATKTHTTAAINPCDSTAQRPSASVLAKLSDTDRENLDRLIEGGLDYIDHPSFAQPSAAKKMFGEDFQRAGSLRPWCNAAEPGQPVKGLAVSFAKTLTAADEQTLFLRFNCGRSRIVKVLRRFAGKRLSAAAVRELLWWDARVERTRAEIVQANMPLVLAMAKRTRLGNIDHAELISEGNMALLRCVSKFDVGRGFKFSTYACRAILKSFSRVAMKIGRYRGRFPVEFDPSLEKSDYLEQQRLSHEADCIDELRGILFSNTASLNETEVTVILERFALGKTALTSGEGPKTLEQVGTIIGVTKERVRQIQNRALSKLREKMQEDFLAA